MESILISIRPEWCELILAGKKTIEIRKTMPKFKIPFKCYIYCTKDKKRKFWIGKKYSYSDDRSHNLFDRCGNGKVIGEFICNEIEKYTADDDFSYGIYDIDDDTVYKTCLVNGTLWDYGKGKPLYGWNISELVIYDTPKELSHFIKPGYEEMETLEDTLCNYCSQTEYGTHKSGTSPSGCWFCEGRWCESSYKKYLEKEFSLKHPPQSWCYVEECI